MGGRGAGAGERAKRAPVLIGFGAWPCKAHVCFHSDVDFGLAPGLPPISLQISSFDPDTHLEPPSVVTEE